MINPNQIVAYDSKTIIITASFFDSIYEDLKKLLGNNFEKYKILVVPYLWFMLIDVEYDKALIKKGNECIKKYEKDLQETYDVSDLQTKKLLDYIIKIRSQEEYVFDLYEENAGFEYKEGYFYNGELLVDDKLTMIDIGAYVGDSAEWFFDTYNDAVERYYAYEPEKSSYEAMIKNLSTKDYWTKIVPRNKALGAKKDTLLFAMETGLGVFGKAEVETNSSAKVDVSPLDKEDILVNGTLAIKMDVEGLELAILKGALETIRQYHPYLAVCVYHKIEDIYEIPAF